MKSLSWRLKTAVRLAGVSEIQHHSATPGILDEEDGRQERLCQGPYGDAGGGGRGGPGVDARAAAVAGPRDASGVVLPPGRPIPAASATSPVTCHRLRRSVSREQPAPSHNSHRLAWTTSHADCSVLNTVYINRQAFEMPSGRLTPVLPKRRYFPVVASHPMSFLAVLSPSLCFCKTVMFCS